MNQQAKQQHYTPLTVVMGGLHHQSAVVQQLTNTAWLVAYAALWNGELFSEKELSTTKNYIGNFLMQRGSLQKNYEELVQRILLTRDYINRHPGKYVPIPSQWFCTKNNNGFLGTLIWFENIKNKRSSMPRYKQSLLAFAQAVQEISETPTANNFHYWRSYFCEHNYQGLLNLFLSFTAYSRY